MSRKHEVRSYSIDWVFLSPIILVLLVALLIGGGAVAQALVGGNAFVWGCGLALGLVALVGTLAVAALS